MQIFTSYTFVIILNLLEVYQSYFSITEMITRVETNAVMGPVISLSFLF